MESVSSESCCCLLATQNSEAWQVALALEVSKSRLIGTALKTGVSIASELRLMAEILHRLSCHA